MPDATDFSPSKFAVGRGSQRTALKVTPYERTAGMLITSLILLGIVVSLLFVVWLTSRAWVKQQAIAPELIEPLAGGGNGLVDTRDLQDPSQEDIEEYLEPELEQTLESISDIVTNQQTTLDPTLSQLAKTRRGEGGGSGGLNGPGTADIIPRWERWLLRYEGGSLEEYARQLDYFGIELAALGGGRSGIDYASRFSQPQPERTTRTTDDRVYFWWTKGSATRSSDLALLARAGIPTANRQILTFISKDTENSLARAEDKELKKRALTLKQVKQTTFSIVGTEDGYAFRVVDIRTRGT